MTLALLAAALICVAIGAAGAVAAGSALKRLGALSIAYAGACLAALSLGVGSLAFAGVAALLGVLLTGVALSVRMQEAYGAVEADAIDAADAGDEPPDDAS